MRFLRVAALALAASLSACGGSDEPTKVWEATGFSAPESALPDTDAGVIYVSNMGGGKPDEKDGDGFISKLRLDGKVTEAKWVTGLDAPKGLALSNGKLYVGDVDHLVEIDVATGTVTRHQAAGAKSLNDPAVDSEGRIYVPDWAGNAIWRLADGTFEKWLESDALKTPNGLLVESDRLVIAPWGSGLKADFSTETPGNLLTVSLADKTVADLGNGTPVGNLDGLEPFDADNYLVTDWVAGKVFQVSRSGEAKVVLSLGQGTADLNYNPSTRTAIIPLMVDGKVVAYKF
ncbi:hypothetical protein [Hyphomicrobium sp.]|uniref:SMP-30/gluconolactonase/LRE family protein n=1 Tax=Hyphomicrobium sp. TaxID=82 RepID=UPI0025BA0B2A|nr:hypothetical protein [Hyphomicrobium sp.]MCC7251211.1 hypothetical protein [Hyphomicrobium sp.]